MKLFAALLVLLAVLIAFVTAKGAGGGDAPVGWGRGFSGGNADGNFGGYNGRPDVSASASAKAFDGGKSGDSTRGKSRCIAGGGSGGYDGRPDACASAATIV